MKNGLEVDKYGDKCWYLNDELHREDGPAQEWSNGYKEWYLHGKEHRADGPSTEWADGTKFWYLHGVEIIHPEGFDTTEEWLEYLNDNESDSYQAIHDINGFIGFLKNPSDKQIRVHQMAHLL